jgi:phosphohistidine phosphatase
MKTLILMRHAESDMAKPGMDDHDRKVSPRGWSATVAMARWLKAQNLLPGKILCSSARRTLETAAIMREAVPSLPEADGYKALYQAGTSALMEHLRRLPDKDEHVLVIGHEPGLGSLVRILGGETRSFFTTAALAVFEVDAEDWGDLSMETASFITFVAPGDLMDNPHS